MARQLIFDFTSDDFAPTSDNPTVPLDENANIKQHDNSNPGHLEVSPESALACLAKYLEIAPNSLEHFIASLRALNANEYDINRVLKDVKDWNKVKSLYPDAIGSFSALIHTTRKGKRHDTEFWTSANSLFGLCFAYTHLGPPKYAVDSTPITQEVAETLEEEPAFKDQVIEESLRTDDCFEQLSQLVPGLPLDVKSWPEFESSPHVASVLAGSELDKINFSRSSPTGKKYFNNVHASVSTWPKGNEGLIRAATGAASDLFSRPLCVFHKSKTPSKRMVSDSSLYDRSLYPENLVRLQENDINTESVDPNLLSVGLASLHEDFNFAQFQHEKYEHNIEIANLSPSERHDSKMDFRLQYLRPYTSEILDAIHERRDIKSFRSIINFYKPSSSSAKEIMSNRDYIHICSLTEAMTVGSCNNSFLCYQFDITNYVLMIPIKIFFEDHEKTFTTEGRASVPLNAPYLDSHFQDPDDDEKLFSTRVFFFPFISATSLGSYQDSNRAVLITALLLRGLYCREHDYDEMEIIKTARTTVKCDVAHLNNAANLALCHGYTLSPVLEMSTLGTQRYKRFVINSGLSNIKEFPTLDLSSGKPELEDTKTPSDDDPVIVLIDPDETEQDPEAFSSGTPLMGVTNTLPEIDVKPPENYEE